jgi:hypothetical protein
MPACLANNNLADAISNYAIQGYSGDTITLMMQNPNGKDPLALAFQERFPAIKQRVDAGLPTLSPAEYLAYEKQYSEQFKQYGTPTLASKDNITKFLVQDVSPTEIGSRLDLAVNKLENSDPYTLQAFRTYYPELTKGDLVTALLDPNQALETLQRKVATATIGGAAAMQNLALTEQNAAQIAALSKSQGIISGGFETAAEELPTYQKLGNVYGKQTGASFGQEDIINADVIGLASAKRKKDQLKALEEAQFGGRSGVDQQANPLGKSIQGKF